MRHIIKYGQLFLLLMVISACSDFLDEKTDKKLVVPVSDEDLQAMLDNVGIINNADPADGEVASDDYFLLENVWSGLDLEDRRAYTWMSEETLSSTSWMTSYRNIYNANVILKALADNGYPQSTASQTKDNIAGQAYFLRAKSLLNVVVLWAVAYDDETADVDLGIPLRLDPDFNQISVRSTNRESYQRIIDDLKLAITLLPEKPLHVLRASRWAAHALLARTYLFMRDYENCLVQAEQCLAIDDELIDYNTLDTSAVFSFEMFHKEIIYTSHMVFKAPIQDNMALVDTGLVAMYQNSDLRRALFFRGNPNGYMTFKGGYGGGYVRFSGIATDEVYLMAAECLARTHTVDEAAAKINHLLERRYRNGSFSGIDAAGPQELLDFILDERRKELLFRGLRFPDVKRLNKEGMDIAFRRQLGEEYLLPPNDLRWALPISPEVLNRAPSIAPNPN